MPRWQGFWPDSAEYQERTMQVSESYPGRPVAKCPGWRNEQHNPRIRRLLLLEAGDEQQEGSGGEQHGADLEPDHGVRTPVRAVSVPRAISSTAAARYTHARTTVLTAAGDAVAVRWPCSRAVMTNGPTLRRGHVINMKLCVLASRSIASWSGCLWPRGGRWISAAVPWHGTGRGQRSSCTWPPNW